MTYRVLFIAVVLFGLSASAHAKTFYEGLKAFNVGDYGAAATIWRPLAEDNDGKAQSGLGFLYYKGLGVGTDFHEALKWFGLAANNGVVQAQMFLSIMHRYGYGVPRSNVWAYMWSDLALAAGVAEALGIRDEIVADMTDAEIAEAQRLVTQWHSAHSKDN